MRTPQIPPLAGMAPLGLAPATERDRLGGADVDQALVPGAAPLSLTEREIARRRPRAGYAPLPEGGLFDAVAKSQLDLFG